MNTRQLKIISIIFLFASLALIGTSQVAEASPIDSKITRLAGKIGKDPVDVCKAILNLKLPQLRGKMPRCEIGRGSEVRKIKDPSGCETHYSLYDSVCQCNRGGDHSELIVLKDKPRIDEFINLKHPCVNCYMAIVKHMIDKGRLSSGEDLTIEWKKPDAASTREHLILLAACEQYKREQPDDFR